MQTRVSAGIHADRIRPYPYGEAAWAYLGLLRFLLAMIVFASHCQWFVPAGAIPHWILALDGKAAVLGFLIISGLSVGYSYKLRPEGYFGRRFWRIYPLYLSAALFTLLIMRLVPAPAHVPGITLTSVGMPTRLVNLFLLQGIASVTLPYNGPLWSVSIECVYYLALPLLIRQRAAVIAALACLSLLLFQFKPGAYGLYGYQALIYLWPWLIGLLIVMQPSKIVVPILLGVFGLLLIPQSRRITTEPLAFVTYLAILGSVLCVSRLRLNDCLMIPFCKWLGDISYPLYLFHFPTLLVAYKIFGFAGVWSLFITVLAVAILAYYIIDIFVKNNLLRPMASRFEQILRFRISRHPSSL